MDFKIVLKEQREELEKMEREEHIIPRESFFKAREYLQYPNCVVIMGVRRCGKSTFSYQLAKENPFGYINFDDERLLGVTAADLNHLLQATYELYGDINCVVLDEIQNVVGWELFVNRLQRTKRVIVTGSNSKLLSGELASRLTGRYLDLTLYPFSFSEFLEFKNFPPVATYTTKEKAELLRNLNVYLQQGGFPEVGKFGKEMALRVYNDILTKDILLRYKIKKKEELRKLAKYLITNFAEEASYSKISRLLDIKRVSTTSNWSSYFEQAFLVIKVERFDYKLKQQIVASKKTYCIDPAIISTVGFASSDNKGKLMENAVLIELLRLKSMTPELEIYYWKDYQHHEVDFVLKQGPAVQQLIQVTYAISKDDIKEREQRSLWKASKELRCQNLLVITWDYEASEKGVNFVPLWKWLIERNKARIKN